MYYSFCALSTLTYQEQCSVQLSWSWSPCSRNSAVIDIDEVVRKHSEVMPNILVAHALTGCNTVSCFDGIGKITVLKKLQAFTELRKLGRNNFLMREICSHTMGRNLKDH